MIIDWLSSLTFMFIFLLLTAIRFSIQVFNLLQTFSIYNKPVYLHS